MASINVLQKVKVASHLSWGVITTAEEEEEDPSLFVSPLTETSLLCGSNPIQRCEFTSFTRASSLLKKEVDAMVMIKLQEVFIPMDV